MTRTKKESEGILLIGKDRDSLDNYFKALAGKLKEFLAKLDSKEDIERKIDEVFGGKKNE